MTEWWEGFFDHDYVDLWSAAGAFDATDEQVQQLLELLDLPAGARILDVPCGFGRIAGRLHQRGFDVVGVDASDVQIELARERNPGPRYEVGDMRRPPAGPFDVVLNLYSSFGYFDDPADDVAALEGWHDVLRPGGTLVMELMHRDRVARLSGERPWEPTGDVREEGETDWVTGIRTARVTDGTTTKQFRIRLYTATDLVRVLGDVGFVDVTATGGFDGGPVTPESRLLLRAIRP